MKWNDKIGMKISEKNSKKHHRNRFKNRQLLDRKQQGREFTKLKSLLQTFHKKQ